MKIVFRFLGTNIFFNEKVNTKNVNNISVVGKMYSIIRNRKTIENKFYTKWIFFRTDFYRIKAEGR